MNMNQKALIIGAIVIVILFGGAYYYFGGTPKSPFNEEDQYNFAADWNTYSNQDLGFEFKYPKTYFLTEKEVGNGERKHYAVALIEDTVENRTLIENATSVPPREGPVSITFDIYQNNLDNVSILNWVTSSSDSNYKLGTGEYATMTFAGEEAVAYQWSGLYNGDTIALENNGNIFALSVTSMTPDDQIRADFAAILVTFKFLK